MPTSIRRAGLSCLYRVRVVAFLLAATALAAQTAAPSAAPSTEERIKALEERIIALEGEVRMLQQQAAANAPLPAPGAAASGTALPAAKTADAGATQTVDTSTQPPTYGGATAMAKALNPDISMIGNFVSSAGRNPVAGIPAFAMRESELGVRAIVDPYARADFFLSFGEEGVELEEGYITFTALPASLVAKAGKMRAAFGKVNTMHAHVLPWIDRPLVTDNLVGGEDGIADAGFSVTRILPSPKWLFLEATGQVYRGDAGELFESHRKADLGTVAHLRGYHDITESTNLDVGLSYARGHNDAGVDTLTQLYGVDATLRWKPLRRSIYHSFVARSEWVWSQRQQLPVEQRAFGFYTSADYQLARRWFLGGRYDWSERARDASLADRGGSLVLTYWPSEFSQLRAQYRYTNYAEGINANELRMQVQFVIGAHGAHPF